MKTPRRFSALQAAQTPRRLMAFARTLAWLFLLGPLVLLVMPWQQNIVGEGRVVAYAPNERQQVMEAPITGRIIRWAVQEGSRVKTGDTLLELSDLDADFSERLDTQKQAAETRFRAKEEETRAYRLQLASLQAAQDLQVTTAQHRLDVARQRTRSAEETLAANEATLLTAGLQTGRLRRLIADGLVSRRDLEVAERDEAVARRNLNSATAGVQSARAEQRAVEVEVERIRADARARVDSATATLNKTLGELEDSRVSLTRFQVDVSRQRNQTIQAPRDGMVLKVMGNTEGLIVKQGDPLLSLVPDTQARAVELWVDGNDAPLIMPGRPVRLQFEGWPAVQFGGYPEVAVGTFGGQVAFIDPSDDGKGKFRLMIVPDEQDEPWPGDRFLRQGGRTRGWVLLGRVTVAYEIWRQLNAFPPLIMMEASKDEPKTDLARKRLK
jgi:multidrug resistance efflux pump